jgi:hypothetical protein
VTTVSSNTSPLSLSRKQLQDFFGNNPELIRAFSLLSATVQQVIQDGGGAPGQGGGGSTGGSTSNAGAGISADPTANDLALELVYGLRAIVESVLLQPRQEIIQPDVDLFAQRVEIIQPDVDVLPLRGDYVTRAEVAAMIQDAIVPPFALSTMAEQSKLEVQILGGTIDSTAIGSTTPSTGQFTGVTSVSSAPTGVIGEDIESTNTGTTLPNATSTNAASISLTAGEWDITGLVEFLPGASATLSNTQASISTTSATLDGTTGHRTYFAANWAAGVALTLPIMSRRVQITATTIFYLVGYATVGGTGGATVNGAIRARRMR